MLFIRCNERALKLFVCLRIPFSNENMDCIFDMYLNQLCWNMN